MSFSKQLNQLLHPYAFVLKEGTQFSQDSLSYDLIMFQINHETIKSPLTHKSLSAHIEKEQMMVRSSLADFFSSVRNRE